MVGGTVPAYVNLLMERTFFEVSTLPLKLDKQTEYYAYAHPRAETDYACFVGLNTSL